MVFHFHSDRRSSLVPSIVCTYRLALVISLTDKNMDKLIENMLNYAISGTIVANDFKRI